ncbi:MAG: O-antigen ligase family protein [bacterium]
MNIKQVKDKTYHILAILTVFFTSWGSGLQQAARFDLSKLFVWCSVMLIVFWLLFNRKVVFPRAFNLYISFAFLHTVITYLFVFPDELTFGYVNTVKLHSGFSKPIEAAGMGLIRIFILVLFAYALAASFRTKKDLVNVCIAYGAGFICSLSLSGYWLEGRLTGGYMDPNFFGLAAATAIFLNFFVIIMPVSQRVKIVSTTCIGVGFLGICLSGSRGAMFGVFTGVLLVLANLPIKYKTALTGALVVIFCIIIPFTPSNTAQMIHDRVSIEEIHHNRGSHRIDIWADYLNVLPEHLLFGTGLRRSQTALTNISAFKITYPHNNYLEVIIEFGIVGFILYLLSIFTLLKNILSKKKPSKAIILGLLSSWLVISFFLGNHCARDTWIILAVVASYGYSPCCSAVPKGTKAGG